MQNPSAAFKALEGKSVLVVIDFNAASTKALQHGIAIARQHHATLFIAHVLSPMAFSLAGPLAAELAAEAAERDVRDYIDQLVVSGALDSLTVLPIVLRGDFHEELRSVADEHQIGLIVIGSDGRQGLAEVLFGSTAHSLCTGCRCPVLTVGPHAGKTLG